MACVGSAGDLTWSHKLMASGNDECVCGEPLEAS